MRQSRQCRTDGGALVTIDLDAASIARLIALGWLPKDRQRDRGAVPAAFAAFVRQGLGVGERLADASGGARSMRSCGRSRSIDRRGNCVVAIQESGDARHPYRVKIPEERRLGLRKMRDDGSIFKGEIIIVGEGGVFADCQSEEDARIVEAFAYLGLLPRL